MQLIRIDNLSDFSRFAERWNELWEASDVRNPNVKANPLRLACEHFYQGRIRFYVLVDESDSWLAAIPFVFNNSREHVIQLPNNDWGLWGDLLLRNDVDADSILSLLADKIMNDWKSPIRFPLIATSHPLWNTLIECCRSYRQMDSSIGFSVGMIQHDGDWGTFEKGLSAGFRKKLRKYERGLTGQGELTFQVFDEFQFTDVESVFRHAFSVEAQSWKQEQSTTLQADQQFDFFLKQARQHATNGTLVVGILELDGTPIAFDFGVLGKGTYFSWKVGFDQRYAKHAPGQVLSQKMVQHFHEKGQCDQQDTVGPVSSATARWSSHLMTRQDVVFSGATRFSQWKFSLLRCLRRFKRHFSQSAGTPKVGHQPQSHLDGAEIETNQIHGKVA